MQQCWRADEEASCWCQFGLATDRLWVARLRLEYPRNRFSQTYEKAALAQSPQSFQFADTLLPEMINAEWSEQSAYFM